MPTTLTLFLVDRYAQSQARNVTGPWSRQPNDVNCNISNTAATEESTPLPVSASGVRAPGDDAVGDDSVGGDGAAANGLGAALLDSTAMPNTMFNRTGHGLHVALEGSNRIAQWSVKSPSYRILTIPTPQHLLRNH